MALEQEVAGQQRLRNSIVPPHVKPKLFAVKVKMKVRKDHGPQCIFALAWQDIFFPVMG